MIRRPPRATRPYTLLPYTTLCRSAPATAVAWTHLGMTLQELGRSAESVAAFRHALLLAPAQADAQQADAQQAAAQQGAPRQDAARHAARRAVTLAPLQASA